MITTIGIIGAGMILAAFILNETHEWSEGSFKYDLVNFVGSIMLTLYAVLIGSIPFAILNVVWAVVSFRDLAKYKK